MYGVATNNVFSLLDEENEDPQALANKAIKEAEQPKPKKEAEVKPKEVAKPAGGQSVLLPALPALPAALVAACAIHVPSGGLDCIP